MRPMPRVTGTVFWITACLFRRSGSVRITLSAGRSTGLPAEISFKTKPQLAMEMLEKIVGEGLIPFRYVVADSIYGNSPEFLEAVAF